MGSRGKHFLDDCATARAFLASSWRLNPVKYAAIAGGISLLAGGFAFAYWQLGKYPSCLRMVSGGNLETVYSMGCINPQQYRRWIITAQRE